MPRNREIPEGGNHPVSNAAETHVPPHAAEKPAGNLSQAITAIWKQVLGLPRVGIDDNFFESGGTSLLATVLVSRINEMLRRENQVELSIASIFEHPTLRAMTSLVLGKGGTTPESSTPTRVIAAAQASTGSIPSSAIAIIVSIV